ncbi:MAG: hypothetical protein HC848_10500 [Limnobacter sp.]|nr:hypothetical protein [Limnobacter sp.]
MSTQPPTLPGETTANAANTASAAASTAPIADGDFLPLDNLGISSLDALQNQVLAQHGCTQGSNCPGVQFGRLSVWEVD